MQIPTEIEDKFEETKNGIEEEIKKVKFEIAKIDDNIYGDTAKECAEKLHIQKAKLKLMEARLENAKAVKTAGKKQVTDRDDELEVCL